MCLGVAFCCCCFVFDCFFLFVCLEFIEFLGSEDLQLSSNLAKFGVLFLQMYFLYSCLLGSSIACVSGCLKRPHWWSFYFFGFFFSVYVIVDGLCCLIFNFAGLFCCNVTFTTDLTECNFHLTHWNLHPICFIFFLNLPCFYLTLWTYWIQL
jgi:hypothetical protein